MWIHACLKKSPEPRHFPSTLKHGQISRDIMHNPLKGYVKQSIYIVALWTPTSHLTTIAKHSFLLKVD